MSSSATTFEHSKGEETPAPLELDPDQCMDNVMGYEEEENQNNGGISTHSTSSISLPKKKSGIFGTSSNLVNSIVGAGIVGIPYALRESGLIAGLILLIVVGYLTDKSLRIIVELASFHPKLKKLNVMTYEDLMSYPFGKWGNWFVLINMFLLAYGAMVAYLLIIKDTVPTILGIADAGVGSFVQRELVMMVTSLLIVLPLSIQRDMATLAFTSLLSVVADIILVIFIAAYSPIKSTVSEAGGFGTVLKNDWINPTIFIGLGILSTAMACQHSAFIVSGSLANKTQARWAAVTFRSISAATILCAVMGICGYLGFLDQTQGNILNNFESDSLEANAARSLLAITMFFTYPMESFVARHVLVKLFYDGDVDGPVDENGNPQPEYGFLNRRIFVTCAIYITTVIPALIVDDLGPVLSITGSLGGSMLSYMAPGMAYIGVNGDYFMEWMNNYLQSHNAKKLRKKDSHIDPADDLPAAGEAGNQMVISAPSNSETSKPWWWFPTLMPIWCALASSGCQGMKAKFANEGVEHVVNGSHQEEDEEAVHPRKRDFIICILFIVFGVIGAVAGLLSNVYVQVNQIFYTPQ